MADTSDFRNGMCFEFKHDLYTIVEFQHVKPGKGPAFVRTKLKNVKTGRVIDNTFTSGEKVKEARVERRSYQYLYKDDMGFNFMNNETFEQISVEEKMIPNPGFLKEGESVEMLFHDETETLLTVDLPQFMVMEVTYTEPGLKGDTASGNTLKPATLETGVEVMVPLFIETGEVIKVDTQSKTYVERVKK